MKSISGLRLRRHLVWRWWVVCVAMIMSSCGAAEGGVSGSIDAGPAADASGQTLDTSLPAEQTVVINEVVAKSNEESDFNPTGSDWIELYNRSSASVNLDGWRLNDSKSKPFSDAIALPNGLSVPPKGYLVVFFNKDGVGSPLIAKGLSSSEAVSLFDSNGTLQDLVDWKDGDAPEDQSWGRSPDGSKAFSTFEKPTPNAPNP